MYLLRNLHITTSSTLFPYTTLFRSSVEFVQERGVPPRKADRFPDTTQGSFGIAVKQIGSLVFVICEKSAGKEIGRASCRERGWKGGNAVAMKKKHERDDEERRNSDM